MVESETRSRPNSLAEPLTAEIADIAELVSALSDPARRRDAFRALIALGPAARAAVREGLGDGRFEVRRGCVLWLLRLAEPDDAPYFAPLLHDPKSKVRHAAVVAISQQRNLHGAGVVRALMERALHDESLRVRRASALLLGWEHPHPDLEGFFEGLAGSESDAKLQRYARLGVRRCRARAAGAAPGAGGTSGASSC